MCSVGAVHVCTGPVQCMRVHGWCSACACSVGAVHAWALLVQHSWSAWCPRAHSGACTRSAQCTRVHGQRSVGSSVRHPSVQHQLSWGGQGLPSPPPANASALPAVRCSGQCLHGKFRKEECSCLCDVGYGGAECGSESAPTCAASGWQQGSAGRDPRSGAKGPPVGPALPVQGPTCACLCPQRRFGSLSTPVM